MVDVLTLVVVTAVAGLLVKVILQLDDQKNSRDAMSSSVSELKKSVDKLNETALTITTIQEEAKKNDDKRRAQAALDEITRQAHYSQF